MSRVDNIINGVRKSAEKKKSRVESIIENSSNGNIKTGVDEKYINTFLSDANEYFSNVSNDYKSIGYKNASSIYDNYSSKGVELGKRADTIRAFLNSNKNNLDEETYNGLITTLNKFDRNSQSISNQLRNTSNYYSKWETEEEYNDAVKAQEAYEANATLDLDALQKEIKDLETQKEEQDKVKRERDELYGKLVSGWMRARNTAEAAAAKALEDSRIVKYDEQLSGYDDLVDTLSKKKVTYKQAKHIQDGLKLHNDALNAEDFEMYSKIGEEKGGTTRYGISWSGNAINMTDEENGIYNYYLGKYGAEKADEYKKTIEETLNYRTAKKAFDMLEDKTALELLSGISAGTEQFSAGLANLFNTSDDYIPVSSVQIVSQMVREDLADDGFKILGSSVGQIGYDLINTTSHMLPSILISAAISYINPVAGQIVGAGLMGASAGGNAYAEMLNLGYDKGQARLYSGLVGASEATLQYLLGGIGKLGGGKLTTEALVKVANSMDNAFARVAIKLGANAVGEFTEEYLQEVLNPVFKNFAFGTNEDVKLFSTEALYSGILGALSAGILEGGSTIASDVKTTELGKNVQKIDGGVERLRKLGTTFSADSVAYQIADKVTEETGAYKIGLLLQEVGGTLSEQNVSDIVIELTKKGMTESSAKKIAKTYQAFLNGEMELTDEQVKVLEGLDPLADVLRKSIIGRNTDIYQRTREYNDLVKLAKEADTKTASQTDAEAAPQTIAPYSNEYIDAVAKELEATGIPTEHARILAEKKLSSPTQDKFSPTEKSLVESKYEVSAEGKTINSKNDEIVSIKNIASISDSGEANLTLDDGMVVKASDLAYGSDAEAIFVENVGAIKVGKKSIGTNSANALYQAAMTALKANPKMTADEAMSLIKGLEESYIYGTYNLGRSGLTSRNVDGSARLFAGELTQEQRKFAYELGTQDAVSKAESDQKVIDELKAKADKDTDTKTTAKKGRVSFENGAVAKSKGQKRAVSLAKHLARAIGIDIVFYDSTKGGFGSDANGYFDEDTDTIYLDLQNSMDDAKTIVFTMSHELVHFIKKWSPEKFNTFAKFLMEQYAKHGVDASELLSNKMAELGTKDADYAYEEMIADACETMLLDSNAVYKLMELRKTDLELFDKIKLHIHELLNKIRDMYKKLGLEPTSNEAKSLLEMKDVLEQIYSLFEEAAVDAAQSYQAVSTLETESVSVSKDGTVMMQMKQYQQTGRATLLRYLKEQYGDADANSLISTIDNIYNTMKEIKKDETLSVFSNWQDSEVELNENGHPIFTTSINNGDYELNQDFSRVCKKRRQLDFVLNMLAEDPAFEASNLTKQDFVKINKAIKEHGFEIACALCFVDSKRFRQAEWADSFANTWNDILYSIVEDKSKLTPFNFATKNPNLADDGIEIDTSKPVMYRKWSEGKEDVKNRKNYDSFDNMLSKDGKKWVEGNTNVRTIATLIRDNPNLRHTFRGADIIASQGFDTIQRLAPGIRGILDGWGGSSVPKPSSSDASYDSSIINLSGYNKETAYAMGGARMNSFSDFMAHMFFDYCQAFADLAAKELPSQAYTKELIYVRLFGRSGQKINMSGIAAIRDDALPTTAQKGVSKAEAEANEKIEKMIAGLDVSRLLEHLNKDIHQLTEADVEQFLDMCDYVWADESINMKHATLLQTGILYDKLSDSKVEECYELLKAGEIEQALKVAGNSNVDTEYAKHCGTIVVGVSDAHIRKLLRDPTVRMVIPYHKSGLNPVIARELRISAYNDYTLTQTTGVRRKGAKATAKIGSDEIKTAYGLKDFSFYDWFGKTIDGKVYDGKATADKYLEWCEKGYYDEEVGDYVYYTTKGEGYILAKEFHKKAKIVPKFETFVGEENYYKVLEDFDCYNTITGEHSAQGAVDFLRNGLPSDYKSVLMDALKAEQKVHDDFRDHLDNKGLKDEIMEIVKAHGYTPSEMSATLDNIVEDVGAENVAEVTEQYTDVENTTRIKKQKKKTSDNTYEAIGKELLYYEEGDITPDLTLVETVNDRTGNKEVTIKHYGQKPANYIPKKIAYCYKLFEQHPDGTLHALFAGAKNAVSINEWKYAQGFPRTDEGVRGMNLRERYGWHLSAGLPSAPHLMSSKYFERGYPSKGAYGHPKGSKRVWVRMAYDASTDFNSIADSTGKQNDIYGLIPFGGYYAFKENNQSEWVISSAVKIDKILTEEERQQILKDAGYDEYEAWRRRYQRTPEERTADELASKERAKAKARAKKLGIDTELSASTKTMRESIKSRIIDNPELNDGIKKQLKKDSEGNTLSKEQQEFFKDSKVRDAEGNLIPVYHGTYENFTIFDINKTANANIFGKGHYFTSNEQDAQNNYASDKGGDVKTKIDSLAYYYFEEMGYTEEDLYDNDHIEEWNKAYDRAEEFYESGKVMKVYLNITNPVYANNTTELYDKDGNFISARSIEGLKKLGFDGIIDYHVSEKFDFQHLDEETAHYVVFDSNQIKSVTNATPTTDPDIRYQKKRNIAPIESEDLTKLEKHFGTTGNFRVAGYLLANGKLLDFSGKHWGDTNSRMRQVDHRDVQEVLDDRGNNGVNAMVDMIGNGNIRLMPEVGGINLAVYPNEKQRRVLSTYINYMLNTEGEVIIDYDAVGGDTVYSKTYGKTATSKQILNDIRNYFQGARQSELMQFHTMYQKKTTSNRSILANALEGAAQNDIEKNKLAEYKEKIALIELEEQRLSEIQKQLFTKGGVEPENRKDLQFEAKQIANRINTYDRQLLNLESTTALKNVLNREKALAMKRQKQKDTEYLKQYKEKVAKTQRELLERNQESRKKAIESRSKTAMRHKIKNVVNDLNNLLLKPSKERHVPEELRMAVSEALSVVNMDTVDAETRVAHYNDLIAKAKDPDVIASLTETRNRILEQGTKLSDKLTKLKEAYEMVRDSADDSVKSMYDDVIYGRIQTVKNEVGKTPIRNMTLEQLESVYDLYKMVLTTIRDSNKAFAENLTMSRLALGSNTFAEIKENNKVRDTIKHPSLEKFMWQNLKPMQAMKTIGSGILQKLWNNILYGQETFAVDYYEAVEFAKEMKEKHGYKKWNKDKLYSFESKSGKAMKLNLEQMMSIYAYSKRAQADEHIEYGGIVLNEGVRKIKNKLGKVVEVRVNDSTAYRLDKMQVADIVATLEKEFPGAKAFVDDMQKYLSETMGAKGNEVSMKMYGIKLFKEEHYFPLKSSKDFMEAANAKLKGDVKIKNKGMTKSVVEHARNPIVLENFLDVWGNHINEMALYHGLVLPLEDFSRTLNYSFKADEKLNTDAESVRTALHDAFGDNADNYLNELLKAINGGVLHDSSAQFADKMISKFKKAKVMASLSVIVQQPTAIIRAMGVIEPKYFVAQNFNHKATWEELKKYCPTAIIKETGSFDTNMGKTIVDMVKEEGGFVDKVGDVLGKAPAYMDEVGWNMIWRALKKKVATEQNLSGEALLRESGKQMTLIINETQVYDSVMSRNELMRSKNALTKMATAFGAEPSTVANMIYGAALDFKRGKKGIASKTVAATITSVVVNGLVSAMVYALRDDDEEKTLLEKYLSSATTEVLDGLNPLTYIPFVKDAYSLFQGYKVERTDMALIKDVVDAIDDFYNVLDPEAYEDMSKDEIARHIYDNSVPLLTSICDVFGLPVGNILRDAEAIIINDNVPMSQTSSSGTEYAFKEGVLSALPKIVQKITGTDSKQSKLYDAIISGDTDYIERLKNGYKDGKAYETAVRQALRENDPRIKEAAEARIGGNIAKYTRIVKEIKAEGFFSQDTIVASVNAEINAINKGESSTTSSTTDDKSSSIYKIDDYYASIVGGDEASAYVVKEDIINTDVANGKDRDEAEDSFNSRFANYLREEYEDGNVSATEAQRMLVDYGNKSEEDATSKVRYWTFKQEYPEYDDLSEEAVEKYYEKVEPYGISVDVYYDYSKQKSKCKGADNNGDGKTDSGSVKAEVLQVINSLPLTYAQKDALYYLNGWSAKTIREAPWH